MIDLAKSYWDYQYQKILKIDGIENRFTKIYEKKIWGDAESVSGSGSSIAYTENLRKEFPKLLKLFSIDSVFDAPCGDCHWMKSIVQERQDIKYIGADIVKPIIEENSNTIKGVNIAFMHLDLTKDPFPVCDLMICRDCLFHLSYKDIYLTLNNFINSNIPYLLTTTHVNLSNFSNKDIASGDFRLIDLFSEPFNFPKSSLYIIQDWLPPDLPREMHLWSRNELCAVIDELGVKFG